MNKQIIICNSGNSILFLNSRYNRNGFKNGLDPKLVIVAFFTFRLFERVKIPSRRFKKLTEKFTEKDSARYIINLSDGQPTGPGYRGKVAAKHTKEVIAKARKAAINVFAISGVGGVVRANDEIYGSDYNVDASGSVAREFKALMKKLILRV